MNKRLTLFTICAALIFSLVSCGSSGSGSIIGKWQGDGEAMKKDPALKEAFKGAGAMVLKMMEAMKFEITKDKIIVEMELMGKKRAETSDYKVISQEGNILTLETTNKTGKKEKGKIEIIDNDHLKMLPAEGGNAKEVMYLKRV